MESSQPFGVKPSIRILLRISRRGYISEETALLYASKRAIVQRGMDQIKSRRGKKTTDIKNLALDQEYQK